MKIAIHKANWGFSPDWIEYCKTNSVPFKEVNCYSTNIIEDLQDCGALLWQHHHTNSKDFLFAKQLLFALEQSGKLVFPDFNTGWHFDDKLGQKFLLESIHAPMVKTDVFFDQQEAESWVRNSGFPKVFKLRGGAGSTNVKLIKTESEAVRIITKAFGKGFASYDRWGDLKENLRKYRLGKQNAKNVLKSIRRLFYSTKFGRYAGRQVGYVLFQEFIPDNKYDIRVVTIGDRAFAIKRLVRDGDFRASGSGYIKYDKDEIDTRCVEIAFDVSTKLNAQVVAYDFVFNQDNKPLIVEINYGYAHKSYFDCPGYWDNQLNWYDGNFNSADWMVELVVSKLNRTV